MITHIYINSHKSNDTFCCSKNRGNNQSSSLLYAINLDRYNLLKHDPSTRWCKKCIKNLNKNKHD